MTTRRRLAHVRAGALAGVVVSLVTPLASAQYRADPTDPGTCDPYAVNVASPATGFGGEYATGWQHSSYPVDGRAWSLGLEARRRLRNTFGLVARVDRSTGRDAALDTNGDGRDDHSTGAVTRWSVLAGPSLLLGSTHARDVQRYVELDGLVGYLATSGQPGEDGPLVGLDFSYQVAVLRAGVRVLQGFGDAGEASAVLAHVGILVGSGQSYSYGGGCGQTQPSGDSPIALALDIPVTGWAKDLGIVAPGVGVEVAWHVWPRFDALGRGDLLVFPSGDRDRVIHQSVLAGGRLDFGSSGGGSGMRRGLFATLLAGYAFAAAPSSSRYGSTPVADLSFGWMAQGSDGAAWVRLHSRVGLPDPDVMAFFLSLGVELRLDRERWQDRN